MTRLLALLMLAAAPALAQDATPTPTATPEATPAATATPYPAQDEPPNTGVPAGFDAAIATPTPTPDPFADQFPPDHDDFLRGGSDDEPPPFSDHEEWDPKKPFPGNYYALPLTVDVGWKPCLDCSGDVYSRPGEVVAWAGYAFQPFARVSSPYMAMGLEATLGDLDENARRWDGRSKLQPTARWGWNFSAASIYATSGVILPGEEREKAGYHVGVGASSFAFMALSLCAAEAIPSVIEVGADFVDDEELGRMRGQWSLKIGWGF